MKKDKGLWIFAVFLVCMIWANTCQAAWSDKFSTNVINGGVSASALDSQGNVYVGGDFAFLDKDNVVASNIARWDGSAWSSLGSGLNYGVNALAVAPDDTLYAGGWFWSAGNTIANHIARWECDETTCAWSAMGNGLDGGVYALAVAPNGTVYAAGDFTTASTASGDVYTTNRIARWNGTSWVPLGSGLDCAVYALAVGSDGTLYAAGDFTSAGGNYDAAYIAKWNGSSWSPLGAGVNGPVYALAIDPNGNLYAGGDFTQAEGAGTSNHIAKWNGSTWSSLGEGLEYGLRALAVAPDGSLYAAGQLWGCAKWDGSAWSYLPEYVDDHNVINGWSYTLLVAPNATSHTLFVGGSFTTTKGGIANDIAKWDGETWSSLGSNTNTAGEGVAFTVEALAMASHDTLYAVGSFGTAAEIDASDIAKWDGEAWAPLGSGVFCGPHAVAAAPDGSVYVGGTLWDAGGYEVNNIARWDGSDWSALGSGVDGYLLALAVAPTETSHILYAGGNFTITTDGGTISYIASWNGSEWSPLGDGLNGHVYALAVAPDGTLYAGGDFTMAGSEYTSNIARWDGSAWSALGSGVNGFVYALAVAPDGTLYAGGEFDWAGDDWANHIARWNGSAWLPLWSPLGDGVNGWVNSLAIGHDGSVYAGGGFNEAGGKAAENIARWKDSTWLPLGRGTNGRVLALAVDSQDNLYLGGDFTKAGGNLSSHFGFWINPVNYDLTADPGGPYTGIVDIEMTFDASNSLGPIAIYEWDWNNDGKFDQSTTSPIVTHTWGSAYDGLVTLRVKDREGNASPNATVHLTVVYPLEIEVNSSSGVAPFMVSLTPIVYGFDLDEGCPGFYWQYGDGQGAEWEYDGDSVEHEYQRSGDYDVTVTYYDDCYGIEYSAAITIHVTAPTLEVGSVEDAVWGSTIFVPLILTTEGKAISGLGEDIGYDTNHLTFKEAILDQALVDLGKEIYYETNIEYNWWSCTGGYWYPQVRILIIGTENDTPLEDGVVAYLEFEVLPVSRQDRLTDILGCPSATSPLDEVTGEPEAVYIEGKNGTVSSYHLWGDCLYNDNDVTVEDVVESVRMFLGRTETERCADRNFSGHISVDEVQLTINNFLHIVLLPPVVGGMPENAVEPKGLFLLGDGKARAGKQVKMPLVFTSNGAQASALSMDIVYDPRIMDAPLAVKGPAAKKARKDLVFSYPEPGVLRVGLIGTNNRLIKDGVAGYVTFTVKEDAHPGRAVLTCTSSGATAAGKSLKLKKAKDPASVKIVK